MMMAAGGTVRLRRSGRQHQRQPAGGGREQRQETPRGAGLGQSVGDTGIDTNGFPLRCLNADIQRQRTCRRHPSYQIPTISMTVSAIKVADDGTSSMNRVWQKWDISDDGMEYTFT